MNLYKKFKKILKKKFLLQILLAGLLFIFSIFTANIFFKNIFSNNTYVDPGIIKKINIKDNFSATLYFNNKFGTKVLSSLLIKAIDNSKKSVEIAVYSMNNTDIRDALYRANKRGVKVVLIFSDVRKATHDQVFKNLPKNIKRIDIPSSHSYMHHKFLIVDRGYKDQKLFFGSYNYTYFQEKYDPSFVMETSRPEIVKVFGEEFDRLAHGLHGRKKLAPSNNSLVTRIEYPQGFLEIWFAPQIKSGLKERMLGLIRNSKNNIKAIIWDFTDKSLAIELLSAAKKEKVKIITDDSNYLTRYSVFPYLLKQKQKHDLKNLEIITDAKRNPEARKLSGDPTFNSFIHHHLLLIDNKITVFGTNNWSNRGFYYNDESVMISNIPYLYESFDKTWKINYALDK